MRSVAEAVAVARHDIEHAHARARARGEQVRPEAAVATLLAAGPDTPVHDPRSTPGPLSRPTTAGTSRGVRELPVGALIGRRRPLRDTVAALRATDRDRERVGEWAGAVLTGVGGIGKTAVAGRAVARLRAEGWWIAEHIGTWNPSALSAAVADALDGHTQYTSLAEGLRDLRVDDRAKLQAIRQLLGRERLLVLFDDFEQNLDPATGQFLDPGFAELFPAVVGAARVGRVLVTCRYPIPDADLLMPIELPPLTPAELRRLFLRLPALRELSVQDRRLVARTIGGHPRLIEFVDVLLRATGAGTFLHVTQKLRALARQQHLDLTAPRGLGESLNQAMLLGSRDIILDTLLAQLTPTQHDLALQAGILTAPFTPTDLLHPTPDQPGGAADVQRLRELTLLSPAPHPGELVVHPWIGHALQAHLSDAERVERHRRAADMRLQRINTGRGGFDDITELIAHLARSGDHDTAVATARQAVDMVGGEVAVSALLAEIVPLIPTNHPNYLWLAERECLALTAIGLVSATMDRYHAQLRIAEGRVTSDPDSAGYQRALSVVHRRLGELAVAIGDTRTADEHYRADLAIAEGLAATDPGNAEYQRDLAIAHNFVGNLAVAVGDTPTTDQHYRASLAIRERLTATDPGNAEYQRDLSISHNRLGDLARTAGDTPTADQHYGASLAIAKRLATTDPGNAEYQRDLSISHDRLGDLARTAGDTPTADQHYGASLAIAKRLATTDPGNAEYQRDLSISHDRLGDLARTAGDTPTTDQHYRASLAIRERLTAADPTNAEYQRDLSISHDRLGDLARTAGDTPTTDQHYRASLAIAKRLATTDPGNAEYQRDLSISHDRLGDLARTAGDTPTTDQHYRASLAIRERLATADPGNAEYQRDLSISHDRLGDLARTAGDTPTTDQHYRASLAIRERLTAADPGNAEYQRDLDYIRQRVATLSDPEPSPDQ